MRTPKQKCYSSAKVMAPVFWDAGVIHTEFMPLGTKQTWVPTMRGCDDCIRLFTRRDLDICHKVLSINTTVQFHIAHRHKSFCRHFTVNFLTIHHTVLTLSSWTIICLGYLKQHLGGHRFHDIRMWKMASHEWLQMLESEFYWDGIFKLTSSWNKCINMFGTYVKT